MVSITQSFAEQTGRQREANQSQPRPARVRFNVTTTGIGESRLVDSQGLDFGCFMLEEPTFSWGVAGTGPISSGSLPLCTAIVLSYVQNSQKLWVGANVGFKVQGPMANVKLRFYLTFEGSTMRSTSGVGTGAVDAVRTANVYAGGTIPPSTSGI